METAPAPAQLKLEPPAAKDERDMTPLESLAFAMRTINECKKQTPDLRLAFDDQGNLIAQITTVQTIGGDG